jgi:hypothetical protein
MNTKARSRSHIALLDEIYNETSQRLAFVSWKDYAKKDSTISIKLNYRDVDTVKHAILMCKNLMCKNNVILCKRLGDLASNCAYFPDWNLRSSDVIPRLCETLFVRKLEVLST